MPPKAKKRGQPPKLQKQGSVKPGAPNASKPLIASNQTIASSSSSKIFKDDKNDSKNEENVRRVLGATDSEGRIRFLIEMMDKTKRIIEAQEAYDMYPKTVIKFFESHIVWE